MNIEQKRAAFEAYLKDCDRHAIVPDTAGAFNYAWTSAIELDRQGRGEAVALTTMQRQMIRNVIHEVGQRSRCKGDYHDQVADLLTVIASAPQPAEPIDKGSWVAGQNKTDKRIHLQSDDFTHDVRLYVDGDFGSDAEKLTYAQGIARQLNAHPHPAEPKFDVAVSRMVESNGNVTFTVWLLASGATPMGMLDGYEVYSSPSKGRADYEADSLRRVLDPSLPYVDLLAYDTDLPPPAEPVREVSDGFHGDNASLISSIQTLLDLDADGALVPHGVGGHARALLSAAASRLGQPAQPAASAEPDVVLRVVHSEHEVQDPEVVKTSRRFDNLPAGTEGKLYATPVAAQPSVPDEVRDLRYHPEYMRGWNACRQAVLAAAPTPPAAGQEKQP